MKYSEKLQRIVFWDIVKIPEGYDISENTLLEILTDLQLKYDGYLETHPEGNLYPMFKTDDYLIGVVAHHGVEVKITPKEMVNKAHCNWRVLND